MSDAFRNGQALCASDGLLVWAAVAPLLLLGLGSLSVIFGSVADALRLGALCAALAGLLVALPRVDRLVGGLSLRYRLLESYAVGFGLVCVLLLAALPLVYYQLGTEICYDLDEKNNLEACALANSEFSRVDLHTRAMYRFLQWIDDR